MLFCDLTTDDFLREIGCFLPLTAYSWRTVDLAWAFSSRFRDTMDDFDASVPCLRTGLGLTKASFVLGSFLLPLRAGYSNETLPAPFEERGGGSVLAGT